MIYDDLCIELDKLSLFKDDDNDLKKRKIIDYASLVMDYNKNINITGAKDIQTFLDEHILDSLLALDVFRDYDNIIDVGSGAGLPSIPLAIMYNDKKFDTITSRAFSDIKTLIRIFKKIKTKNASLIAYKGKLQTIEEELKEINDIHKYDVNIVKLASNEKERHLVIIRDK